MIFKPLFFARKLFSQPFFYPSFMQEKLLCSTPERPFDPAKSDGSELKAMQLGAVPDRAALLIWKNCD